VVLDFDGTILDTEESIYRSWVEFWDDHGHQLERSDWQQNIGGVDRFDPWAELEHRLGRPLEPGLRDAQRRRRDEIQADQSIRLGILAWLSEAETLGIPVGVASSSSHRWVGGHLDRLGIRDRFATVVCADEAVPSKPDPASYRLACARLGAEPTRSVAVEDSPTGVSAATDAGLYTVAVPHDLTRDLDLRHADVVVDSLSSLSVADIFERASARRGPRVGSVSPPPP
jgi:beta-phosphoglucomutase-like phosphatase (HAD superfamily)